jgi:hypothetical protein
MANVRTISSPGEEDAQVHGGGGFAIRALIFALPCHNLSAIEKF